MQRFRVRSIPIGSTIEVGASARDVFISGLNINDDEEAVYRFTVEAKNQDGWSTASQPSLPIVPTAEIPQREMPVCELDNEGNNIKISSSATKLVVTDDGTFPSCAGDDVGRGVGVESWFGDSSLLLATQVIVAYKAVGCDDNGATLVAECTLVAQDVEWTPVFVATLSLNVLLVKTGVTLTLTSGLENNPVLLNVLKNVVVGGTMSADSLVLEAEEVTVLSAGHISGDRRGFIGKVPSASFPCVSKIRLMIDMAGAGLVEADRRVNFDAFLNNNPATNTEGLVTQGDARGTLQSMQDHGGGGARPYTSVVIVVISGEFDTERPLLLGSHPSAGINDITIPADDLLRSNNHVNPSDFSSECINGAGDGWRPGIVTEMNIEINSIGSDGWNGDPIFFDSSLKQGWRAGINGGNFNTLMPNAQYESHVMQGVGHGGTNGGDWKECQKTKDNDDTIYDGGRQQCSSSPYQGFSQPRKSNAPKKLRNEFCIPGQTSPWCLSGGAYGDMSDPVRWGSGGSRWVSRDYMKPLGDWTQGGGFIKIVAKKWLTMFVGSKISSDGGTSSNIDIRTPGASGGSVWIVASKVFGAGTISTSGGNGFFSSKGAYESACNTNPAGAGGRVAVDVTSTTNNGVPIEIKLMASGGSMIFECTETVYEFEETNGVTQADWSPLKGSWEDGIVMHQINAKGREADIGIPKAGAGTVYVTKAPSLGMPKSASLFISNKGNAHAKADGTLVPGIDRKAVSNFLRKGNKKWKDFLPFEAGDGEFMLWSSCTYMYRMRRNNQRNCGCPGKCSMQTPIIINKDNTEITMWREQVRTRSITFDVLHLINSVVLVEDFILPSRIWTIDYVNNNELENINLEANWKINLLTVNELRLEAGSFLYVPPTGHLETNTISLDGAGTGLTLRGSIAVTGRKARAIYRTVTDDCLVTLPKHGYTDASIIKINGRSPGTSITVKDENNFVYPWISGWNSCDIVAAPGADVSVTGGDIFVGDAPPTTVHISSGDVSVTGGAQFLLNGWKQYRKPQYPSLYKIGGRLIVELGSRFQIEQSDEDLLSELKKALGNTDPASRKYYPTCEITATEIHLSGTLISGNELILTAPIVHISTTGKIEVTRRDEAKFLCRDLNIPESERLLGDSYQLRIYAATACHLDGSIDLAHPTQRSIALVKSNKISGNWEVKNTRNAAKVTAHVYGVDVSELNVMVAGVSQPTGVIRPREIPSCSLRLVYGQKNTLGFHPMIYPSDSLTTLDSLVGLKFERRFCPVDSDPLIYNSISSDFVKCRAYKWQYKWQHQQKLDQPGGQATIVLPNNFVRLVGPNFDSGFVEIDANMQLNGKPTHKESGLSLAEIELIWFETYLFNELGINENGIISESGLSMVNGDWTLTCRAEDPDEFYSGDDVINFKINVPSACPAGTVFNKLANGGDACVTCGAGKYQESALNLESKGTPDDNCLVCAVSKFIMDDGTDVTQHDEASDCQPCPVGRVYHGGAVPACEICGFGKYNDQATTDVTECKNCPLNTFLADRATEPRRHDNLLDCVECDAGTFSKEGARLCGVCASGQRADKVDSECTKNCEFKCINCLSGRFQKKSGNDTCEDCLPGFFQNIPGQPVCLPCNSGKFQNLPGQLRCKNCGMNNFAENSTAESCTTCPTGYYSAAGSASCQMCEAGRAGSPCIECAAGRARSGGDPTTCRLCEIGQYQEMTGRAVCLPCNRGFYANTAGQQQCNECQRTTFQDASGNETCRKCPSGYFSTLGASSCQIIRPGSFGISLGNLPTPTLVNAATHKICQPGYFCKGAGSLPTPCQAGRYSAMTGTIACISCAPGFFADQLGQSMCKECALGQVQQNSEATKCKQVREGYEKLGPTTEVACPAGKTGTGRAATCKNCGIGRYQNVPGNIICAMCPSGWENKVVGSTTCVRVPPGSYRPSSDGGDIWTTMTISSMDITASQNVTVTQAGYMTWTVTINSEDLTASLGASVTQTSNMGVGTLAVALTAGAATTTITITSAIGQVLDTTGDLVIGDTVTVTSANLVSVTSATTTGVSGTLRTALTGAGMTSVEIHAASGSVFHTTTDLVVNSVTIPSASVIHAATNEGSIGTCQPGFFCPGAGSLPIQCQVGRYSATSGSIACIFCSPGYFQNEVGKLKCKKCLSGQFQSNSEASKCTFCISGKTSLTSSTECHNCPPGKASDGCKSCSKGKYRDTDDIDSTKCLDCEIGLYSSKTGQPFCLACDIGRFSDVKGLEQCKACPLGFLNKEKRQEQCVTCKSGTEPNKNISATGCVLPRWGRCTPGAEYLHDAPFDDRTQWECRSCKNMEGVDCSISETVPRWSSLPHMQGYWAVPFGTEGWGSNESFINKPFVVCPFPNRCPAGVRSNGGNRGTENKQCLQQANPDAPACAVCLTNHFEASDNSCLPCERAASTTLENLAIPVILVVIAVVVAWLRREQIKELRRRYGFLLRDILRILTINISYAQINSSLPFTIKIAWPQEYLDFLKMMNWVNFDLLGLFEVGCVDGLDYRFQVAMACMVPISVVLLSLLLFKCRHRPDIEDPDVQEEAVQHLFDMSDADESGAIDRLEFTTLLSMYDANRFHKGDNAVKMMMQSLGASSEDGLSIDAFISAAQKHDIEAILGNDWVERTLSHKARTERSGTLLMMLFLLHAPVSQVAFYYFSCQNIAGRSFLHFDYSLECFAGHHLGFVPFVVVVLLVFTCGLPFLVAVQLCRKRNALYEPKVRVELGFLYVRFNYGCEYWELHEMLRKCCLVGLLIFLPEMSRCAAAILLCVVCCCTLNYFQPHRSSVVLLVSQISFLLSTFKYVVAVFVQTNTELEPIDRTILGWIMVMLDVLFIIGSVVSILLLAIMLWKMRNGAGNTEHKDNKRTAKEKRKRPVNHTTVVPKKQEQEEDQEEDQEEEEENDVFASFLDDEEQEEEEKEEEEQEGGEKKETAGKRGENKKKTKFTKRNSSAALFRNTMDRAITHSSANSVMEEASTAAAHHKSKVIERKAAASQRLQHRLSKRSIDVPAPPPKRMPKPAGPKPKRAGRPKPGAAAKILTQQQKMQKFMLLRRKLAAHKNSTTLPV